MTIDDAIGTYEFEHPTLGIQTFTINRGGYFESGSPYPASITFLGETLELIGSEYGENYVILGNGNDLKFIVDLTLLTYGYNATIRFGSEYPFWIGYIGTFYARKLN